MSMMKQECGWFDEKNHSSAELSARLTGDAGSLQSVCQQVKSRRINYFKLTFYKNIFQVFEFAVSSALQPVSTFLVSIIMAMMYSWKLALVCLTSLPVSCGAIVIENK